MFLLLFHLILLIPLNPIGSPSNITILIASNFFASFLFPFSLLQLTKSSGLPYFSSGLLYGGPLKRFFSFSFVSYLIYFLHTFYYTYLRNFFIRNTLMTILTEVDPLISKKLNLNTIKKKSNWCSLTK